MVVILRALTVAVEDLSSHRRLPSVDALRPSSCPCCSQVAYPPGERLGIVGHGTYTRQVLGLGGGPLEVLVRRYRCRGCGGTASILPDGLLPWRWYAGTAIVVALVLSLLLRRSAAAVRERLDQVGETAGWKTLERWQRRLLAPLWRWKAAQVGVEAGVPGKDRGERAERLRRLLALACASARSPDSELEAAARTLGTDTAHTRERSWSIARAG